MKKIQIQLNKIYEGMIELTENLDDKVEEVLGAVETMDCKERLKCYKEITKTLVDNL